MPNVAKRHPEVLCSLVVIRDHGEFRPRSAIRSTALFTVSLSKSGGARFSMDHQTFDRAVSRADVLAELVETIPLEATLIARASRTPQHYLRHSFAAGGPLPVADLKFLHRERRDLDICPLECANRAVEEIAAAYRIERAGPGSNVLSRARRAPDEAQSLWLAFLWSQYSRRDRTWLSAAWEAWRALERARPLPF